MLEGVPADARPGWRIWRYGQPCLVVRRSEVRDDDRRVDPAIAIAYLDTLLRDYYGRRAVLEMFAAVAGRHASPERAITDAELRRSVLPRLRDAFRYEELVIVELERISTPSAAMEAPPPEPPPRRAGDEKGRTAPPPKKPTDNHWIEILLLDEKKKPVPGESYRIELPGGAMVAGSLDENGLARHDNIEAGSAKICFPDLDAREWSGDGEWRITRPPLTVTLKQGDHISSLAKKYGFGDYRIIWDDPKNARLKTGRKNPNVLLPGDEVYIPEKREKQVQRPVDQRHPFDTTRRGLMLRIRVLNIDGEVIASQPCTLQVEGAVYKLTTDPAGVIEREIARDAGAGLLEIMDMTIPVAIGHMDPEDTPTGQQARLANLGYYWGPMDESDPQALQSAIEEFQCDHPPLKVDGKCGAATQAKLKEVHGC